MEVEEGGEEEGGEEGEGGAGGGGGGGGEDERIADGCLNLGALCCFTPAVPSSTDRGKVTVGDRTEGGRRVKDERRGGRRRERRRGRESSMESGRVEEGGARGGTGGRD